MHLVMISRALGPEFGGSIGIIFYMANVLSSALYLTGCVEGLLDSFGPTGVLYAGLLPGGQWISFGYASALNAFNVLICVAGSELFAKTTATVFCAVSAAILLVMASLGMRDPTEIDVPLENSVLINQNITKLTFTGISSATFSENVWSSFGHDYSTDMYTSFSSVFGVLFTGVTGVLAGANMSGELRKPSKSIPKGTLTAMMATFCTYLCIFFVTAASCPKFLLRNNYAYMQQLVFWPPAVAIGVLSATLSAALSNLIGASRVAAALGADRLFEVVTQPLRPKRGRQPIAAVLLTGAAVQALLLVGRLNQLAQVTSVCFMLAYAAINLACLALTLTSAPNFRPSFRFFSGYTCTGGLCASLLLMFTTSALYASGALLLCLLLVFVLHLQAPPVSWGSISQALIFHQVRKYLLLLDARKAHVKYWRPQLLLFVASPRSAVPLIEFANDLKKSGLYVLGHVHVLKESNPASRDQQAHVQAEMTAQHPYWLQLVDRLKVKAFVELTAADTFRSGCIQLARLSGLGALKPNTVLIGFRDDHEPIDFFATDRRFGSLLTASVSGRPFAPLRTQQSNATQINRPDDLEYVSLISDLLYSLDKNVCLARNFERLMRSRVFESRQNCIDVWPSDPFAPIIRPPPIDNCWLFVMQLACILRMVPGWKQACKLRVMMYRRHSEALGGQWHQMLRLLRINATIVTVAELDPEDKADITPPDTTCDESSQQFDQANHDTTSNVANDDDGQSRSTNLDFKSRLQVKVDTENDLDRQIRIGHGEFLLPSESEVRSLNTLIRKHSADSALLFTYLPLPPFDPQESQAKLYMQRLDVLTKNLPPTLMVHGISPVTSTTL